VAQLVEAVNARLAARQPAWARERTQLQTQLADVQHRLDALRRFLEQGDTSPKVRQWLSELEVEEQGLRDALADLTWRGEQTPLRVLPTRVEGYLEDLRGTLLKDPGRARSLLHADLAQVVIHPVRPKTGKPFARAEVVTTGKGLLDRVAFVVAGARKVQAVHLEPTEILIK
jgi:hypothetical protein